MVWYQMLNKLKSVVFEKGVQYATDRLILTIEYTMPSQEDGHAVLHGDRLRSIAEAVIYNIPLEPIAKVLEENGIESVRPSGFNPIVDVKKTGRYDPHLPCMEIYEMEIRLSFTAEEDTRIAAARSLINEIQWKDTKIAMKSVGLNK